MTYTVVVEREDDLWVAHVPEVPGAHTQARNLAKLDEHVRDVVALVLDLPDGAEPTLALEYEYVGLTPEAASAAELGRARAALEARLAVLVAETNRSVVLLVNEGWSVRDIGPLLGVSAGRVSQITSEQLQRPA